MNEKLVSELETHWHHTGPGSTRHGGFVADNLLRLRIDAPTQDLLSFLDGHDTLVGAPQSVIARAASSRGLKSLTREIARLERKPNAQGQS